MKCDLPGCSGVHREGREFNPELGDLVVHTWATECIKCGAKLRPTKYPDLVPARYWFDEKGMAGCPQNGFHEVGEIVTMQSDAANMIAAALDVAMPYLADCDPKGLSDLIAKHTTCDWTITKKRRGSR